MAKEGVHQPHIGAETFCGSIKYLAPEMVRKTGHGKSLDWYLLGVLLYEMLIGVTPYYSENKEMLFDNILYGKLMMPRNISIEARDLIIRLLNRNPSRRLGSDQAEKPLEFSSRTTKTFEKLK
jgi:serine/threonine protein kinase